jgi:cytochrome c biogenesis factor
MTTVLTFFVSLIFIVISVFISLIFKNEVEQMFRGGKEWFAFHICNVVITLMVAFASQAVMTIYISGDNFHLIRDVLILIAIILPVYILGHLAFEKYKFVYRKFSAEEKGKVLELNEKYLKKKKRFKNLKNYNAMSRED